MHTPSSAFLRQLRRALVADLEPEIDTACRIGVLLAAGYKRSEIARLLPEVTGPAFRLAETRVKRAAGRLDQGDKEHHQ